VVFYLVQVGVQVGEGERSRLSVLRRFSDFRALHSALLQRHPPARVPTPPQKHSLQRVNHSPALIEERRVELEQWLWKLLADTELAHSTPLVRFLELAAARNATRIPRELDRPTDPPRDTEQSGATRVIASPPAGRAAPNHTPRAGDFYSPGDVYRRQGSGYDSDDSLGSGSMSNLSEAGGLALRRHSHTSSSHTLQPHSEAGADPALALSSLDATLSLAGDTVFPGEAGSSGTDRVESSQDKRDGAGAEGARPQTPRGADMGAPSSPGQHQLALPVEQRANVRRLLDSLRRRQQTACTDLEDVVACLQSEVAVKDLLAEKVGELEGELEQMRQAATEAMQSSQQLESERLTNLQWEMQELRTSSMLLQQQLQDEKDGESASRAQATELQQQVEEAVEGRRAAEAALASMQSKYEHLETQSKAEKKLLSKEVKTLRKTVAELKEQVSKAEAWAEAEAAARAGVEEDYNHRSKNLESALPASSVDSMMKEVKALQGRLRECTLDKLAPDHGIEEGIEMLGISDNRISCLLAEAQLLFQGEESDSAHTVRRGFADLLSENAQLRKAQNSLLRNALVQANAAENQHSHGGSNGSFMGDVQSAHQALLRRFL